MESPYERRETSWEIEEYSEVCEMITRACGMMLSARIFHSPATVRLPALCALRFVLAEDYLFIYVRTIFGK